MANTQNIRIAITCGGIAGPSLLHALLPHPHLDVHIFEAALEFREGGASIAIHGNAMRAYELIGASTAQYVERACPFFLTGVTIRMAVGEEQGRIVGEVGHKGCGFLRSVGPAALLQELLASVSPERMHSSKKLEKVDHREDSSVELYL